MTLLPHPVVGGSFASPVAPGTGWPDDPASPDTPVARTPAGVRRLARADTLDELTARVSVCAACDRLVTWREDVARDKRASFADQPYWGRPIAGWGDPEPTLLVVGLAPAANGGNRTGRIFTGDPSADWLFASLHRTGWASQPTSEHAGDGQQLLDARMVATVRCAPPDNKPTPAERDTCAPWIAAELALLPTVRAVVALGSFGWDGAIRSLVAAGAPAPARKPKFAHAAEVTLGDVTLIGCYHPSPHNTYTGRLTAEMTDAVFERARRVTETSLTD
ncbi:uracil-DNA glycosylase [Nocardioides oleivorans]|uniref:Type-5 uracil-DNA glycosylase n=1 Tax=Nocardioides oleivorans TaxID=273676 RepID=A0A4Q2S169_9ACTN|nr:uracil-DNA glycosylase [Nocardioides oleivorans]RYB94926.1 uracil-DNA glycosylase [Nocardioides oleivorans]